MMGNRIFYENILQDSMQEHYNRITDEVNVITLKDYMQVVFYFFIASSEQCFKTSICILQVIYTCSSMTHLRLG